MWGPIVYGSGPLAYGKSTNPKLKEARPKFKARKHKSGPKIQPRTVSSSADPNPHGSKWNTSKLERSENILEKLSLIPFPDLTLPLTEPGS